VRAVYLDFIDFTRSERRRVEPTLPRFSLFFGFVGMTFTICYIPKAKVWGIIEYIIIVYYLRRKQYMDLIKNKIYMGWQKKIVDETN